MDLLTFSHFSFLTSPYESCQKNSCTALCRLTTLEENQVSTFSHGGLRLLIQLSTSSNRDISLTAIMVLCNLATCAGYQIKFVEDNGLPTLRALLSSEHSLSRKNAIMLFCNLTSNSDAQDHVARQVNFSQLFELMNDTSLECKAFATMTLCNLASKEMHGCSLLDAGGMEPLVRLLSGTISLGQVNIQRATLLTLYNLATCEASHDLLSTVMQPIVTSCRSSDVLCRRFALMILASVACSERTRAEATKARPTGAAPLRLSLLCFLSSHCNFVCPLAHRVVVYRLQYYH